MLPDLPVHQPKRTYLLSGRFINRWINRIIRQTPLEGDGVDLEYVPDGIIPHARGGAATAAPIISYGFQVSWKDENEVTVAPGCISTTVWGTPDWTDPVPGDWLDETVTSSEDVAAGEGDSIWLEIAMPRSDTSVTGPLPTSTATEYVIETGAGGGGGQGGGGGGGGDSAGTGTAGAVGSDATGLTQGAGGDGAGTGGGSPGSGSGTAGFGGNGGDGGEGGAGEVVTFTHYTLLRLRMRRYNRLSVTISASPTKPTSSETAINIRLATISAGAITQYHAGNVLITLPFISFVP